MSYSLEVILYIVVLFGSLQNIFGKASKYSLYDATKEMIYIPLEEEMKTKGKVAVTILGAQLGKNGGSLIQIISFTLYPNAKHEDIAEFLFICFFSICIIWIISLYKLSKNFHANIAKSRLN